MQRSIYIKDDDVHYFDRAQEIAGAESLSVVITEAVRKYVVDHETRQAGYEEIVLKVGPEGYERTKRFIGRFLADDVLYVGRTSDRRDKRWELAVYETAKGRLVLYAEFSTAWQGEQGHSHLVLFNTTGQFFRDARSGVTADDDYTEIPIPGSLADAVEEALGRETGEWLDI